MQNISNEGVDETLVMQFCRYQGSTVIVLASVFLVVGLGKLIK